MESGHNFHITDYAIFLIAIVSSLAVGLYHGLISRRNRFVSNKEYLVGNRNMPLFPVSMSLVATFVSGHGLLGTPAEVYSYGTQYAMHIFAAVLGNLMGVWLFVPLFYPLNLTSCYEYLEMRYNSRAARVTANITKLVNQLILNGVAICAPAVALQTVTGIPVSIIIVICGTTATIYTTVGGMKAVVWTDLVQSIFIFLGLVVLNIIGIIKTGGIVRVWEVNQQWHRIEFFNFSFDPTIRMTFWTSIFSIATLYFCLTAIQPSVQRFCSLPSMACAKKSLYINIVGLTVAGLLCCGVGIVAFAYYAGEGCDPVRGGTLRNSNQILSYFVMDVLTYPGLPGLFVACLVSAALSTSSSTLNACGAMVWKDLLSHFFKQNSERRNSLIIKFIVVCIGALAIGMAFVIANLRGTFVQIVLGVAGSILGPITGIFILGATNPKAGGKAGLFAMFVALAFNFFLNFGSMYMKSHNEPMPSPIYNCSTIKTFNISEAYIYSPNSSQELMLNSTVQTQQMPGLDRHEAIESAFGQKLTYLFSFSYLYYPVFGISIVFVLGSLLSLLPGLRHTAFVPDELLFPYVRFLRSHIYGHDGSETDLQATDQNENKIYSQIAEHIYWDDEQDDYSTMDGEKCPKPTLLNNRYLVTRTVSSI